MSQQKTSEISTKDFFIKYGICVAFITALLIIVIYTTRVAHNAWGKNLRYCISKCLDEKEPGAWGLGANIEINNPISTSCACYQAKRISDNESYYAVIARVTTFYGPLNCVFLCTPDGEVEFVGATSVHGRICEQIKSTRVSTRINYFAERLPTILGFSKGEL